MRLPPFDVRGSGGLAMVELRCADSTLRDCNVLQLVSPCGPDLMIDDDE
jgi:hypothetical protein